MNLVTIGVWQPVGGGAQRDRYRPKTERRKIQQHAAKCAKAF